MDDATLQAVAELLARIAQDLGVSSLTVAAYNRVKDSYDGPSRMTIIKRLGSWNAACRAAGLRTNTGGRSMGSGAWTDTQIVASVVDYLRSDRSPGSGNGYLQWARTVDGAPSLQAVTNQLGDWAVAKRAALTLLQAEEDRHRRDTPTSGADQEPKNGQTSRTVPAVGDEPHPDTATRSALAQARSALEAETDQEPERAQRGAAMVRRRAAGETLASIGKAFGVSSERARQVIAQHDGPDAATVQAARAAARAAADAAKEAAARERVQAWFTAHPVASVEEVVAATGMPAGDVQRLLGADAKLLLTSASAPSHEPHQSDDEVLRTIARVAEEVGAPLTQKSYDRVRQAYGGQSVANIFRRFGSWNAACRRAGLAVNKGRADAYERAWTTDDVVAAVAEYLQSDGSQGSFSGYGAWAAGVDGAPSSGTVRNYLGSWTAAKRSAVMLIQAQSQG